MAKGIEKQVFRRFFRTAFQTVLTAGLAIALWLGVFMPTFVPTVGFPGSIHGLTQMPAAFAFTDQQQLVMEVWRIVNRSYVDETFNHQNWWFLRQKVLKKQLPTWDDAYTAIQDMLAVLEDPYTRFLPPDQYKSLQTNTNGELLGVGLQIAKDEEDGNLRVIAPIEGSPAEAAGLLPQDEILEINGTPTRTISLDEAAARMRGAIGSQVALKVGRVDQPPFEVSIRRDRIEINPVTAELRVADGLPKLGYLRLGQFNGNAASELRASLQALEKQGADAYILDLRNNPGGLLTAGIEIARMWMDEGTVVFTVNRQGGLGSYDANGRAITADPLVVLVNKGTASASEILAGALQDNGRAQLVGETTFGKGLIQSLFDLPNGAGLAVTIAKYETPSHKDINKLGIVPDQTVETSVKQRQQFGTEEDAQYEAAVALLTQTIQSSQSPPNVGTIAVTDARTH
ncbi:MAG: carboxyl-terminal processing protease [Phormidesmis priestleyi Ana]|uniref:Carboxyl-terminal-processing protease n=1 Tax=Phormidesmis priestleyi Ana TaxID=1666911 RepID=A0A0P7ZGL5_9CYAN|nr:MAG: carboxyl-terminal processing protease [Phormidesmis priestleyi Ana]